MPRWKKWLIGVAATIGALIVIVALLYAFGSMWVPTKAQSQAFDAMVAAGQAAPVKGQFHIPIPGCVCHSDDPVLVAEHRSRRIRECMTCH